VIDTHAHIMNLHYGGAYEGGTQGVVERAVAAGVRHINCVGAGGDIGEVRSALAAARTWPGVSAICGIHPHDAQRLAGGEASDLIKQAVRDACADPCCVAVGETGLDFHYDLSPRDQQFEAFEWHVALARQLGKPLCIHTRNAEVVTLDVLRRTGARAVGGVIHCFSGTAGFGLRCVEELGFYLSVPGIVTFKNPGELPEAVRRCPLDRLLVETDSPFLAPMPFRGKRCEPAYIGHTLRRLAEIRGITEAEALRATSDNAVRLFGDRLRTALSAAAIGGPTSR